ncbi:hypothetical protein D0Y65_044285 [Glycine soja]|uniref:Uncharacterized protein n=1 Tax=Glycine soja TaxID=3848 RepID=A0A445GL18_GLYSO|nr:hypothetical protein D0Y65_044285 [Glycine soja]
MGEGYCTQPYPCICKEAVSGFEPMTNKSPRHNFTAAPGLALCCDSNRVRKIHSCPLGLVAMDKLLFKACMGTQTM